MATTGTVSQTTFNTRKVIDHAFRRCRIPPEGISSEQIQFALETLYLITSSLANRGLQLWCIERFLMPMYEAVGTITLPDGTVDVLNANLRTLQEIDHTAEETATIYEAFFEEGAQVTNVGILWSGASSPFVLETSTDGATWTNVGTFADPGAVSGEWTWADTSGAIADYYFRVRATTGNLNQSGVFIGDSPSEIPMYRMNRDDYVNLPNKQFEGRPLQFWLDRQLNNPVMRLWPTPNAQFTTAQAVVWVKQYIMDIGSMTQEVEVPQRWFDALTYLLAARLAEETPSVDPAQAAILDQKANRALLEVEGEERDNSPIYMTPNIGIYTR